MGVNTEWDEVSSRENVEEVLDRAKSIVLSRLMHIRHTPKNRHFQERYNVTQADVRAIISTLRVEDYDKTSYKQGYPEAYVFGPFLEKHIPVYLKFSFKDTDEMLMIEVLSVHDLEREFAYPYRRRKKK